MSLFEKKKITGFWPVYDDTLGDRVLTVSPNEGVTVFLILYLKLKLSA